MSSKYKVAVLGLGGVGAFVGGKLAAHYFSKEDTQIIFIARGENGKAISEHGLKLVTAQGEHIVHPHMLSSDPSVIGIVDLLIVCTKAYNLKEALLPYAGCIGPQTLILPLLNGVSSTESISAIFPQANVLQGCIYIVSKLLSPGVVRQAGDFYSLHFGSNSVDDAQLKRVDDLFKAAGINSVLEGNITERLWAKFAFISPLATYTSACGVTVGDILADDAHITTIRAMMHELMALAAALGIKLAPDTVEKNFEVMGRLPMATTSSMQADFANGNSTELETLTGYVVKKGKEAGVPVDNYESLYVLLGGMV